MALRCANVRLELSLLCGCVSVVTRAFFAQSCPDPVHAHLTAASTDCVDGGEGRHYNTYLFFLH